MLLCQHLLGHILLTRKTPAQMSQKRVISVVVCGQSARTKWRKCGEQMNSVGSLSLELQMRLSSLATSIVASTAKTFRCWRMDLMMSWDTFKVSSLLPVTSDWDWDTWLTGAGFWRKSSQIDWAGSPKGAHYSRFFGHSGSRVSFYERCGCGWFWSPGCHVTSPCQDVVADWSVAIGRPLRAGLPTMVAIHINCQPSEHWHDIIPRWAFRWRFPVPCVLVSTCIGLLLLCFSRSSWTGYTPASFVVCSVG